MGRRPGGIGDGSRTQLQADAHRYDEFTTAGYAALRFTWGHITNNPTWITDMVQRTLRHWT